MSFAGKRSGRKHRNGRGVRHFLYLSSLSRTSRTDHNALMKYASGVSGYDPAPGVPVRVLAPAARLLSMNVRRPLLFYAFPSLRLFLSLPPPPLSLSLSLSLCIHFCAFKKSPRITNLAESELTGVTGLTNGKKTRTHQGTRLGCFFFSFSFFSLLKYNSSMRVKPS